LPESAKPAPRPSPPPRQGAGSNPRQPHPGEAPGSAVARDRPGEGHNVGGHREWRPAATLGMSEERGAPGTISPVTPPDGQRAACRCHPGPSPVRPAAPRTCAIGARSRAWSVASVGREARGPAGPTGRARRRAEAGRIGARGAARPPASRSKASRPVPRSQSGGGNGKRAPQRPPHGPSASLPDSGRKPVDPPWTAIEASGRLRNESRSSAPPQATGKASWRSGPRRMRRATSPGLSIRSAKQAAPPREARDRRRALQPSGARFCFPLDALLQAWRRLGGKTCVRFPQ